MRTTFTGNMAKEVFNVVIVNRRFGLLLFFKVSFQAPFRHRYRFKTTGLAPVSKKTKNDTVTPEPLFSPSPPLFPHTHTHTHTHMHRCSRYLQVKPQVLPLLEEVVQDELPHKVGVQRVVDHLCSPKLEKGKKEKKRWYFCCSPNNFDLKAFTGALWRARITEGFLPRWRIGAEAGCRRLSASFRVMNAERRPCRVKGGQRGPGLAFHSEC